MCVCVHVCVCVYVQELEEQLAEQKRLLQCVATRGEEIMIQQASPSGSRYGCTAPLGSKGMAKGHHQTKFFSTPLHHRGVEFLVLLALRPKDVSVCRALHI